LTRIRSGDADNRGGPTRPHQAKESIIMDTQTHTTEAVATIPAHNSRTMHPISLADLHVSPLNMRAEKKEPGLKRMAVIAANILPTIREKGIQTPLIVTRDLVLEPYLP
jgi:hypothetical protein